MSYKSAKGVFDILPRDPEREGRWRESHLWHYLEETIRALVSEFGYREIRTPLFESTELFTRSIGTSSDIVKKEMYTFHDKAERSLTLRPEGTAPVMRAFIEKNLSEQGPIHKFFYIAPMFRYERNQAGRYRQHHQFGVEAIGSSAPHQDAEVIHLLWTLYQRLGLQDLTLMVNSIGDQEARNGYRKALKDYLRPHLTTLSNESQERFETNPIRILDSKNGHDQHLLKEAPHLLDFLGVNERAHFDKLLKILEELHIPFEINHRLVRGLDYYNNTVFEITSTALGAQNSLGGGGRYDGLIKELGGPNLPATGFGAGLERIIQTLLAQNSPTPLPSCAELLFIPLGDPALDLSFFLTSKLREAGYKVEIDLSKKKLKQALSNASSAQIPLVAVIGESEIEKGQIELKQMRDGKTIPIPLVLDRLKDELQKNAHRGRAERAQH